MIHETPPRFTETSHRPGPAGATAGQATSLESRAAFLESWNWSFVIDLNREMCLRSGFEPGINGEANAVCAAEWADRCGEELTLKGAFDILRKCQERAPFLNCNGPTFADLGRRLGAAVFANLLGARLRQITAATSQYIEGTLDRETLAHQVEQCCAAADLVTGTRVRIPPARICGVVIGVLADGRILCRSDAGSEFTMLPEALVMDG